MAVTFRWLGVAGIELRTDGEVLLIDPYLTRVPMRKTFFGRIRPDLKAVEKIEKCDYILVTHAHFDHLLDVAPIITRTGATVAGSFNTRKLLEALGVAPELLQSVHPGDDLTLGAFEVKVFRFEHATVPGYDSGDLPKVLKPPLRARDYRMDFGCCYHITAGGLRFLTDPGFGPGVDIPADILFLQPFHDAGYYRGLLGVVQPKLVIPIHWDNLFNRESIRPYFAPPEFRWPPFKRVDLGDFAGVIKAISPEIRVLIPESFKLYDAQNLL